MKVQDQHQINPETQSCQTRVTGSAVFHGDCLELMKNIPDGSIDMILCDLPYGTTQNKWDSIIPFDELWQHYKRIIKINGAIVLTAAQPFTSALVMSNTKMFRYDMTWEKSIATGFMNAKKMPLRGHEDILVFYKKLPVYNPQKFMLTTPSFKINKLERTSVNYGKFMQQGSYGTKDCSRYPRSVFSIKTDSAFFDSTGKSKMLHPTQKPVALFEYLIKTYSNEGETILDNCAGSGTTAIACMNTKRKYILIEKEEKYFDIINKRISNHRDGELSFDAVS